MANAQTSPRRYTLYGPIRILDLSERRLSLGGRDLFLAPNVQTSHLDVGIEIVAKGYEEEHGDRWIVDTITITSVPDVWRRPVVPGRPGHRR
jgi:hypothetical protein